MKLRFLNISPIVLSAILSTGLLMAADQEQSPELETRVSQLEKKMKQVRTETALGTYTASSASAEPQNEGYGLFLTADLVLWNLYEGTAYQDITNTTVSLSQKGKSSTSIQSIDLQKKNLDFKWDLGFKAGVGYVMAHDSWDAYFNYTQFRTHANKSSKQTPPNVDSVPLNTAIPRGGVINFQDPNNSNNSAKTKRKINLYIADLELGKSFFITKYFSTRPFIGAKTAWIHQKLTSENDLSIAEKDFISSQLGVTTSTGEISTKIEGRNNFWGIGPRVGIDMNWFFARYFNLYSNLSGSVLWGNFKVHQNETTNGSLFGSTIGGNENVSDVVTTSPFTNEIKASPHRFVPTVQLEMGIEFNIPFNDNAYNFSVKAGYENQYWWRQNFLTNLSYYDINTDNAFNGRSSPDSVEQGKGLIQDIQPDPRLDSPDDLGFHGLTIEFRLDF